MKFVASALHASVAFGSDAIVFASSLIIWPPLLRGNSGDAASSDETNASPTKPFSRRREDWRKRSWRML